MAEQPFDVWKLIEYIQDNDTATIAKMILTHPTRKPSEGVEFLKQARTEFGLKIVDAINEVNRIADVFVVGQQWVVKHDYANNFRKGETVEITRVTERGAVLSDLVEFDRDQILENFEKKLDKSKK